MDFSSPDLRHDNLAELLDSPEGIVRTSRALVRLARSIVGDEGHAQEVVQSAWLEAWHRPPGRRAKLGIGWLRSLVRSRALDAKRRAACEPALESTLHHRAAPNEEVQSRLDTQRLVLQAVEALGEPYRTTIYLRYFEGLTTQAIAERLGVPVKTVRSQVWRAHGQLRERLGRTQREADGRWSPALLGFAYGNSLVPGEPVATTAALTALGGTMKKLVLTLGLITTALLCWSTLGGVRGQAPSAIDRVEPGVEQPLVASESLSVESDQVAERHEAASAPSLPPAPVPASVGALEVRVLDAAGGPAQAQIVVRIQRNSGRSYVVYAGAVGAEGFALFPNLAPGTASIVCDRKESKRREPVEIVAGQTTRVDLVVDEGLTVLGRVVDSQGSAVAGARIWLTMRSTGWVGGSVATVSDDSGQFQLVHVPRKQSVGAFADGFGPSRLVDLEQVDIEEGTARVELVLASKGARLFGTVKDETGAPVSGARVVCGEESRYTQLRGDGTVTERWTPRSTLTNEKGEYQLIGLPASEPSVEVRSPGRALFRGAVVLREGESKEFDVVLSRGAGVHGRVVNELGQGVAGALVFAHTEPIRQTFLQGGQVDYEGFLAYPAVETEEDGSYRLEHMPPGQAYLCALEQASEDPDALEDPLAQRNLRTALHELETTPEAEYEWNPVLSTGLVIEGRVLYQDGVPITNTFINLASESLQNRVRRSVYTTDGSFCFLNLERDTYRLRVQLGNKPEGSSDPSARGVSPHEGLGGPPLEIVAGYDSPRQIESARVSLLFEDAGERALNDAVAVMMREPGGRSYLYGSRSGSEAGEERWSFALNKPGEYRAIAMAGERVIALGEPFEVVGGETLDLGYLRTRTGASLVVRTTWDQEHPPGEAYGYLVVEGTTRGQRWELDAVPERGLAEWRFDGLEPGACDVRFFGGNCCEAELVAHLVAGKEVLLEHHFEPGSKVPLSIRWDDSKADDAMVIRIVDLEAESTLHEFPIGNMSLYPNPIEWTLTIPVGRYRFELDRAGEPLHRQPFEVTDPSKPVNTITFSEV